MTNRQRTALSYQYILDLYKYIYYFLCHILSYVMWEMCVMTIIIYSTGPKHLLNKEFYQINVKMQMQRRSCFALFAIINEEQRDQWFVDILK